jgi:hypothetical protein
MKSLGKRFLAGATTEVKSPRAISFHITICSGATDRPPQEILDRLRKDFIPTSTPGGFEPRVVDVSGDHDKALDMFSGISKLDIVSDELFSVSSGALATVSATRSMPYISHTTTETDPDGSTRVIREETSEVKFGVSLNLMATAEFGRDDEVQVRWFRSISRPTYAAEVADTGTSLPRIEHRSYAEECLLRSSDALVLAEFHAAETATDDFTGEVIITVVSAKV